MVSALSLTRRRQKVWKDEGLLTYISVGGEKKRTGVYKLLCSHVERKKSRATTILVKGGGKRTLLLHVAEPSGREEKDVEGTATRSEIRVRARRNFCYLEEKFFFS